MAWWRRASGGKIERHDTKLDAGIRLLFARVLMEQPLDALGLYRSNPETHPDAVNVLPEMFARFKSKITSRARRPRR